MMIDRRRLLGLAGAAMTSGLANPVLALGHEERTLDRLHPLTRSLLDRARRIDRRSAPDKNAIERTIREYADLTGWTKPLVIKWMDSPTDVLEHLNGLGLGALLDMGSATFWRRCRPAMTEDEKVFDRCYDVHMEADRLLHVNKTERILMAPKLLAKIRAQSSNLSESEVFQVRAISAQIGWLETSMAAEAARAISNVELLLALDARPVLISHQLRIFRAHEQGLVATWEAGDRIVCIPGACCYGCGDRWAIFKEIIIFPFCYPRSINVMRRYRYLSIGVGLGPLIGIQKGPL